MNKTFLYLSAFAFSLISTVTPAQAKVLNLMNETVTDNPASGGAIHTPDDIGPYRAGFINGAIFRRPEATDELGSGGGVFRNLYTVQANSLVEQGYNRNKVMNAAVPGGFDKPTNGIGLAISDLQTDKSGLFYVFSVDVNEEKNAERYISLDNFEIYAKEPANPTAGVDSVADPSVYPTVAPGTVEGLGDSSHGGDGLGESVYSMDAGENSTVFIDYSTSNGSGTFDLYVFVPVNKFSAYDDDSLVFIYTEFGGYTDANETVDFSPGFDFQVGAGAEEVAALQIDFDNPTPPVIVAIPEPSSALLLSLTSMMFIWRRRK